MVAGIMSVVGAGGCSLLILDDMDFSDSADEAESIPTSTGAGEKPTNNDDTLPAPSSPEAEDGGAGAEAGSPPGEKCVTETKSPFYATNIPTGDGQRPSWSVPGNALKEDMKSTSVTLRAGEQSARLALRDFRFAIPQTARIRGVYVDVWRDPSTNVEDNAVNLEIDTATRRPTNSTMPWFSARTKVRYGPGKPLWDYPLTPEKINATAFGFNIVVKASGANPTANVDSVSITVDYCVPSVN